MLTQAPNTATWAGSGAKVETSAIVREPTRAVPRNLKLKRTERERCWEFEWGIIATFR